MVPGSRSKSRKNINPRRREEGYVLTRVVNPTQPNPRVTGGTPAVIRRRRRRPGTGKRMERNITHPNPPRLYPDATTRVSTVPITTPIAIDRAIASSSAKPRGVVRLDARERRTRAHPRAATRSRGKRKRFILHRRRRFILIVVVVVRVFSFSSFPPLPQDRARRGFQRAGSTPTVASPSIPPWFVSHHVSSS